LKIGSVYAIKFIMRPYLKTVFISDSISNSDPYIKPDIGPGQI